MPIVEQRVMGSIKDDSTLADGVDTTSVGVLVTKTIAAGKKAKLMFASYTLNTGTPTVQLQLVRGGTTVIIRSDTASWREAFGNGISLIAADVIKIQITGGSSGTSDAMLSVEEYD